MAVEFRKLTLENNSGNKNGKCRSTIVTTTLYGIQFEHTMHM
jgi:hypothetical protein